METVTYKNLKFQGERKKISLVCCMVLFSNGLCLNGLVLALQSESINWVQIIFYCWFDDDSPHQAICQDFMMALNGNV